jgi:hypothetical protein
MHAGWVVGPIRSDRRGLARCNAEDVHVIKVIAAAATAAAEIIVLILLLFLLLAFRNAAQSVEIVLALLDKRRQVQQQARAPCV